MMRRRAVTERAGDELPLTLQHTPATDWWRRKRLTRRQASSCTITSCRSGAVMRATTRINDALLRTLPAMSSRYYSGKLLLLTRLRTVALLTRRRAVKQPPMSELCLLTQQRAASCRDNKPRQRQAPSTHATCSSAAALDASTV